MVADIAPGASSASPGVPARLRDDLMVFAATSPATGSELWASDGTSAGTRLVRDINPAGNSAAAIRAVVNGKAFLVANDGVNGAEPWVSDGTEAGTRLLINLDATSASTKVNVIAPSGNQALIFARGGMWSSDGTPEGTTSVVPAGTLGSVSGYTIDGGTVYFMADGGGAGRELWKTDGTAAGTVRITDIAPGSTSGVYAPQLIARDGVVYFLGSATASTYDLWKSDGTTGGTVRVGADVQRAGSEQPFLVHGGTLLYIASDRGLWRSDGTTAGTYIVDTDPAIRAPAAAFGALYYFRAVSGVAELWSTGGTADTTRLIGRLTDSLEPPQFARFAGGKLYFTGWDRLHGEEPWVCTDGTAATVALLANLSPDAPPSGAPIDLTAAGNLVFFIATDDYRRQLWRSDGTAGGTIELTNLGDPSNNPWLSLFTGWNGALYFKHSYTELWKSDGTVAGTALLKNFAQGYNTPSINRMFSASSFLYLNADDGDGPMLWRTDGTLAGTIDVGSGFEPYRDQPGYPGSFAELAGRTYFVADLHDRGIFVTEGTAASTKRVTFSDLTTPLAEGAGALFFSQSTETHGDELWRSDGTLEGTTLVKDIAAGAGSSAPRSIVGSDRYVFFVANDGSHGNELWRSDGTAAGTILLKDIRRGGESSAPSQLTVVGNVLYFVASDGVAGLELWRSDGTQAGTVLVSDIRPGSGSSDPQGLTSADGTLWFAANDGTSGSELWRTTSGGAVTMVSDLEPGPGSSSPSELTKAGTLLYFAATTALGRELWALTPAASPVITIGDVRITEENSGTNIARFTLTRAGDTSGSSSVTFTTLDLSASAGTDYVASSGTVTFGAGVTTQVVDVAVIGDTAIERNEAFLVTLTGATGAVVGRVSGAGIIEDDDARAELSIELLGTDFPGYSYRVTNAGPSIATGLSINASHSPGKVTDFMIRVVNGDFCRGERNPTRCVLGSLGVGESMTIVVEPHLAWETYTSGTEPPGTTVTADVQAEQLDTNPADDTVSRMIGADLEMPPFLTNGQSSTITYRLQYTAGVSVGVALQSSRSDVTITPPSATIPPGESTATFAVRPENYAGRVKLTRYANGSTQSMMVVAVQPDNLPTLDVGLVRRHPHATYGNPVVLPVELAAVRHDGTRPTGTVTLLDLNGTVLAQQALDGNASTTFQRTGLAPGRHEWTLRYSGDVNFNALDNVPVIATVKGMPTETKVEIPGYVCGSATLTIRVRNTATTEVPAGTVDVSVGSEQLTLTLAASGAPGEAVASVQRPFATGQNYLSASYRPASVTFASSSSGAHFWSVNCAPFNLNATANRNVVSLSWTAQPGAHHYDVLYAYNRTGWVIVGAQDGQWTSATSFVHNGSTTDKIVPYIVRAIDMAGNVIAYSAVDLANTSALTDDPLVPGVTVVKAVHISELQNSANSIRFMVDYTPIDFPRAVRGAPVRSARILELREAINHYRVAMGLPAVTFTDATPVRIKAAHVQELRDAMR